MNKENTKKLIEKFPKIFSGVNESPTQNLMCFGFECEDGWYHIIDALCEYLQHDTDHNNEPQIKAIQVKEKYGELRFYVHSAMDRQYGMIDFAEKISTRTCEICGNAGDLYTTTGNYMGWYKTLCPKCAKELDYKLYEEKNDGDI